MQAVHVAGPPGSVWLSPRPKRPGVRMPANPTCRQTEHQGRGRPPSPAVACRRPPSELPKVGMGCRRHIDSPDCLAVRRCRAQEAQSKVPTFQTLDAESAVGPDGYGSGRRVPNGPAGFLPDSPAKRVLPSGSCWTVLASGVLPSGSCRTILPEVLRDGPPSGIARRPCQAAGAKPRMPVTGCQELGVIRICQQSRSSDPGNRRVVRTRQPPGWPRDGGPIRQPSQVVECRGCRWSGLPMVRNGGRRAYWRSELATAPSSCAADVPGSLRACVSAPRA